MVCKLDPKFISGEHVVSLAIHPPEIENGTKITVISPHYGTLVAVKLSTGELHRWFADFELEPINSRNSFIQEGASPYDKRGHDSPSCKGISN